MGDELKQLRNNLQDQRQKLAAELKEIDENLAAIDRVLNLVESQYAEANKSQIPLLTLDQETTKFADSSFKDAVLHLFKENVTKFWAPKEIVSALLKNGFNTKSKDFSATARTMLGNMRGDGLISGTKIKKGYLYGYKENGPAPSIDSDPSAGPTVLRRRARGV